MITSYAKALEDVVLSRALRDVEKGFWIDVGANHPLHYSVTKTFSERGFANRAQGFAQRTITVPCRKLSSNAVSTSMKIHFIKIDVEGAERSVLEGCDFARFSPWIVMIEATEPLSTIETHRLWEGILASVNYDFTLYDGLNRFYLASEKEDLQPALVFPADN